MHFSIVVTLLAIIPELAWLNELPARVVYRIYHDRAVCCIDPCLAPQSLGSCAAVPVKLLISLR